MKLLYPLIILLLSCSTEPENNKFPFYACGDGIDGGQPICQSSCSSYYPDVEDCDDGAYGIGNDESESPSEDLVKITWYFSLSECLQPYSSTGDTTSRPPEDIINKVCNCTGYNDTTCVEL